jgi:hypothetical protein
MPRIGIRYCGGCNPTYERVEKIIRIQSQFRRFTFTPHDRESADVLVLVNGCPRACSEKADHPGIPCRSVCREGDFDDLALWLNDLEKKGDIP